MEEGGREERRKGGCSEGLYRTANLTCQVMNLRDWHA